MDAAESAAVDVAIAPHYYLAPAWAPSHTAVHYEEGSPNTAPP